MEWDAFIRERFFADERREHFMKLAFDQMREFNLGHVTTDEMRHFQSDFATQLYETDLFTQFSNLSTYTQEKHIDSGRRYFDFRSGESKEIMRIAIMMWISEEEGFSFKKEDDLCSDISPVTPRSESCQSDFMVEDDEHKLFLQSVHDIPSFYREIENDRKRKAEVQLFNSKTNFSATVPSESGKIVEEIYKLRKICDTLTEEVFERSPWVGVMFLDDDDVFPGNTFHSCSS